MLAGLKNNIPIIIRQAAKGRGLVIQEREAFLAEVRRLLEDDFGTTSMSNCSCVIASSYSR